MFKFLTSNLGAKFLALFFALSLWVYVVGVSDKVETLPFKIPIEAKNVPSEMALASELGEAELKIKAPYASWERLKANDFSCFVNLAGFSPGEYELELMVTCADPEVTIIEKKPFKIKLKLDLISSKKLPIEVKIEGKPQEGYLVTNTEVNPSEVELRGPKSIVESIFSVQAPLLLENEMAKTEKEAQLKIPEPYSKIVGLVVYPASAKVTVFIQKETNIKTVGVKLNLSGAPAENYWISKIITDPNSISITGKSDLLKTTEYLESQKIDVSGAKSNLSINAPIIIPSGLVVIGGITTVKVKIYLSPTLSVKTIPALVRYKNGTGSTTAAIKVTLSGFSSSLAKLNSKNVIININLAGKPAGANEIKIEKEMIVVPSGFEIIDFSPKTITINVT